MIYSQIENAFAAHDAFWNIAIETQAMESVSAFIRQGPVVGLLDPFTARRYGEDAIAIRRFEPAIQYKIALLLPRDRLQSALLEEFIATIRREFEAVGERVSPP